MNKKQTNLESSGFKTEQLAEREPHKFEFPARRIYLLGRKQPKQNCQLLP